METPADIGERQLIRRLGQRLRTRGDVVCGIGDDCAVVRPSPDALEDWLLTSDALIEGLHFLPVDDPVDVGRKAIGRVLSDIAAMGGAPRWGLIDLVAPPACPTDRLDRLYEGVAQRAAEFNFAIVGGDTAAGNPLALHVFGVGVLPRGEAVLRAGARPGDVLFVTGRLGGSRSGHHLRFTPRVVEGQWLRPWATAMIDLSDGLATDLRHLATASGVGARLDADRLPIAEAALGSHDGHAPLQHALTDGEDYELLFALRPERCDSMLAAWPRTWQTACTRVGVLTTQTGCIAVRDAQGKESDLSADGFEHFRM